MAERKRHRGGSGSGSGSDLEKRSLSCAARDVTAPRRGWEARRRPRSGPMRRPFPLRLGFFSTLKLTRQMTKAHLSRAPHTITRTTRHPHRVGPPRRTHHPAERLHKTKIRHRAPWGTSLRTSGASSRLRGVAAPAVHRIPWYAGRPISARSQLARTHAPTQISSLPALRK